MSEVAGPWAARFAEVPARIELPARRPAEPAETPGPTETPEPTETPADGWEHAAVLLAGLVTRYLFEPTAVVVTVARDGRFVPVVVDLADGPGLGVAHERWQRAWDDAVGDGLTAPELARLAGDLPAVAQAVVLSDDTDWPPDHAYTLGVRAGESGLALELDEPRPDVLGHLGRLTRDWRGEVGLGQVPLLGRLEVTRLVDQGRGATEALGEQTVLDLVVATARRDPDRVAVGDRTTQLTYGDLLDQVDRVAAALVRAGVAPGSLVGLCAERTALLPVAMLAIHRCGAGYVPIDPAYPADRIAMMVEDSGLSTVLTSADLVDRTPTARHVLLDDRHPAADDALDGVLPAGVDGVAYVIFTSGSTGRPKGVVVGQGSLASFARSMCARPGLGPTDRLLAVTTLSFDIAELELLVPLVVGGCVVVADRASTLDPGALASLLDDLAITVLQATPATWQMLVGDGWPGRAGLRMLCGGEALPRSLADALLVRGAELWNMYGPTETTIWSLVGRVGAGRADLVLGEPILNTVVLITDRWGNPCPDGLPGELSIGGAGVARGYLGRPDLTAERFVPDRLTGADGVLYRTGDLVRRRPGRGVEFIGRIDGQVKVRGFRVELAEVEAALEAVPGVDQAVAVTRADPATGQNLLLGYVVGGADLDPQALREQLRQRLPEYMVPSSVITLSAFPLTLNGKIDRASLPEPAVRLAARDRVEPRSLVEARLQAVWEEVLGVEGIGVHDDVFDLGSSSLTTARLYARVAREFHVDLPIAAAYAARTIADLADLVGAGSAGSASTPSEFHSLVPIRAAGDRPPLFLVHGGAGTILLFEPLARLLPPDVPVYALQAAGLYGLRAPQTSVPAMASLYLDEIRRVQPHGPYRIGGYCFGALVAFEMAAQLERRGAAVDLLISFNGPSPSYLRQFRPLFDANGALTDESGARIAREVPASSGPSSASGRTVRAVRRLGGAARRRARRSWRTAGIQLRIRSGRALPDRLREAGVFQDLAARAQAEYHPGRVRADLHIVAGAGLYHQEDVGWSQHVDGDITVQRVEGDHLTPRASMRRQSVGPIAAAVAARLDELDAAGAADAVAGSAG